MKAVRFALLACLALTAPPLYAANPAKVGAGPAPLPAPVHFSDAEKASLKRISAYLNGLNGAQGHFLQIGPDGRSDQGAFYMKKPGRMRFEYDKPNPNLVISDGTTIAVENAALHTTDRYPLIDSPLKLLLGDNVDLTGDPRIRNLHAEPGAISVTARQDTGPAPGQITLLFADTGSALELRQWEVLDAQGLRTTVVLNGLRQADNLSPRLFTIEDLSPFKRNTR